MKFYHGTSSKAGISDKILPPSYHSFGVNEEGRVKHADKVFFTTVKGYAEAYARRACKRVGGNPIVYKVECKNASLFSKTKGCDVWFGEKAKVISGNIYKI